MDALLQQLEQCVATNQIQDGLNVLQQMKLFMIAQDDATAYQPKYIQALELGVLLSVAAEDLDGFARNMQQLQPLYDTTTQFPRKNHILGLNLMWLLIENRLSEFHSECELLSSSNIDDLYLQFPIALERKMMVGVYDEVLQMSLPHKSYEFFMNQMFRTVRDSIADCMEVSYTSLSIPEAMDLMKCKDEADLRDYIATARDDWIIDTDRITFQPDSVTANNNTAASSCQLQDLPSMKWIQQSLAYATEMEKIV